MAAPLPRGANVGLTREIPSLTGVVLGIRWNVGADAALGDNLVGAVLLCDTAGNVISPQHMVFFNQLVSPDASVAQLTELLGDDNEQIEVDFATVPLEVDRIVVALYLNEGTPSKRTLGQLSSCSVRVLNRDGNAELVHSEDLATAMSAETALIMGQLYRHQGGWKFKCVGQGSSDGLAGIARVHGLTL